MKHRLLRLAALFLFAFSSCARVEKPVIATFQCLNNSWDHLLSEEMQRQAALYPQYDFRFNISAATAEEEAKQIEEAIARGVDAIIVNPYDEEHLTPVIEKAYDQDIPVILVGQKISSYKYNAFIGCNNSAMGRKAADKIANLLPDGGNIIIINGFSDAETAPPYYRDRSYAFIHEFDGYPDVRLTAEFNANWDKEQAHYGMDSLKTVLGKAKVDLVFSYGYEMLQGASESMKWPEAIYIGMEGVPGDGIKDIISGQIDATFVSPTGGTEAINTAVSIIKGTPYAKDNILDPFYLDSSNAPAYDLLTTNIVQTGARISSLSSLYEHTLKKLGGTRKLAFCLLALFIVCCGLITVLLGKQASSKAKNLELAKSNEELEMLNKNLAIRCEVSERVNRLLESEKATMMDVVNEVTTFTPENEKERSGQASFMSKFHEIVSSAISETDLSVETMASRMNLSRAQLFRRVKAETGLSPNEMILEIRLTKAKQLLANTNIPISDIAKSTGFSSPSYFSKCFKERFGISPSESKSL